MLAELFSISTGSSKVVADVKGIDGSDGEVLIGVVKKPMIATSRIAIIGRVSVEILVGESIVVYGRGRIRVLTGESCVLISSRGPLLVNEAYCRDAILMGGRHPVVVAYIKSRKVYTRRVFVNGLDAEEWIASSMSSIRRVKTGKAVFIDPHSYMMVVEHLGEIEYGY